MPTLPGWLAVVDDDTLVSVERLQRLLDCYDARRPLLLGQRFAYAAGRAHGYDYVTGGGGMAFSAAALRRLVTAGRRDLSPGETPLPY